MNNNPRRFQPCAEQAALAPGVSGNAINGLGDAARRRPTPVYWHRPSTIPHGPLQQWMLEKCLRDVPEVGNLDVNLGGRGAKERAPRAPVAADDTPENWTARVMEFARAHEADMVGVARVDPLSVFEGYGETLPMIIVLGLAMDQPRLVTAPEKASVIEVMTQYNRGTRAARAVADFILSQGYAADPHGGPTAGPILLTPAALDCGFGELGKHGSIINRTHGSSFRLAGVLTDMPLAASPGRDALDVDSFCANCKVCAAACPPGAITDEKRIVRGVEKWYVDFDLCNPYFNETNGCGICIGVCPWSRPGVAPRLAEKMARRNARRG